MDSSDRHPLDQWDDLVKESQQAFNEQVLRDTSLVFSVFSTPQGEELVSRWMQILALSPTATKGDDLLSVGINEGYKSFIRTILNSIKVHEETL